ncbi:MAG: fumarylacetoacetate hydrolase family protein [Pseudomonadales bacterium]|nr:fumarylacetoacetate hydrolase family protein [Pseudomonadales bacterium]
MPNEATPNYQHRWLNGEPINLPAGKVVCVGRNYAAHAKELNNPIPEKPILFIKPSTALVSLAEPITLKQGQGSCHYETEIALLIGTTLKDATPQQASQAIKATGIALDLTLRDLQTQLKKDSHPWEIAKGFDGACPISEWIPVSELNPLNEIELQLSINGEIRQQGNSRDMIAAIPELISYMSSYFTLQPGDIVLTGTPKGVGALRKNDELQLILSKRYRFLVQVG